MKPELFRADYEELTSCLPENFSGEELLLKWLEQKLRLHWVPTQTMAIRMYAIPISGAHIILASYRSRFIRIKWYVEKITKIPWIRERFCRIGALWLMGFSPWFPVNFPLTIHISDIIRISHDVPPFYPDKSVVSGYPKKLLVNMALGITHPFSRAPKKLAV